MRPGRPISAVRPAASRWGRACRGCGAINSARSVGARDLHALDRTCIHCVIAMPVPVPAVITAPNPPGISRNRAGPDRESPPALAPERVALPARPLGQLLTPDPDPFRSLRESQQKTMSGGLWKMPIEHASLIFDYIAFIHQPSPSLVPAWRSLYYRLSPGTRQIRDLDHQLQIISPPHPQRLRPAGVLNIAVHRDQSPTIAIMHNAVSSLKVKMTEFLSASRKFLSALQYKIQHSGNSAPNAQGSDTALSIPYCSQTRITATHYHGSFLMTMRLHVATKHGEIQRKKRGGGNFLHRRVT